MSDEVSTIVDRIFEGEDIVPESHRMLEAVITEIVDRVYESSFEKDLAARAFEYALALPSGAAVSLGEQVFRHEEVSENEDVYMEIMGLEEFERYAGEYDDEILGKMEGD